MDGTVGWPLPMVSMSPSVGTRQILFYKIGFNDAVRTADQVWPSQVKHPLVAFGLQLPPKDSSSCLALICSLCTWRVKAVSGPLRSDGEYAMTDHGKVVLVRQYNRFRFGQWETVCMHMRSLPRR